MAERGILEFSNRGGDGDPNVWYCEGNSPVVDEEEGGGTWFCFEEPFVESVVLLFGLGFNMREVYEAWSKGVEGEDQS